MKTKTTAALLALFLGGLGAHKFYLGKWVWGLIYLVFCFTFVPAVIALIEAIMFFSMSDSAFQEKYCGGAIAMTSEGVATPETHVRCPDCRELIRRDARKCKHCGSALQPQ